MKKKTKGKTQKQVDRMAAQIRAALYDGRKSNAEHARQRMIDRHSNSGKR